MQYLVRMITEVYMRLYMPKHLQDVTNVLFLQILSVRAHVLEMGGTQFWVTMLQPDGDARPRDAPFTLPGP